jgi:2-polyprenyl-3-methyl-5-hydroxy-6-metoxy-1,4-benzoquinol methylase
MAKEFPNSRFVGYDLSTGAIKNARAFAKEHGVENVSFEVQDLTHFHKNAVPNTFDFITAFDAIHDQARPDHVLQGIARSLRPTGIFLMQDIAGSSDMMEDCKNPMAAFLYTISCMHCMTVSLAQGGMGVGAMWGRGLATRMLKHAGFTNVSVNQLDHDPLNYYYVVDKA